MAPLLSIGCRPSGIDNLILTIFVWSLSHLDSTYCHITWFVHFDYHFHVLGWSPTAWGWWKQRKENRWYQLMGCRVPKSRPGNAVWVNIGKFSWLIFVSLRYVLNKVLSLWELDALTPALSLSTFGSQVICWYPDWGSNSRECYTKHEYSTSLSHPFLSEPCQYWSYFYPSLGC